MALAFGGGVRPELGRTDYTSFLQGSLAGAQMQARGGESIGKALANLGKVAGEAIGQYQEKKQERQFVTGAVDRISTIIKGDPYLAESLNITDPNDKGAIKAAMVALGNGNLFKGAGVADNLIRAAVQQRRESDAIRQAFTPSTVNSQAGRAIQAGASFEQLPQGLGAFMSEMQAPEEQMATLAAGGVAPNMIPGLMNAATNARDAEIARQAGPEQPELSFPEQQVQAEMEAFIAENGRQPRPDEMARIYQDVAKRTVAPVVSSPPPGYELRYDDQGRPLDMRPIPGGPAAQDISNKEASKAGVTKTLMGMANNLNRLYKMGVAVSSTQGAGQNVLNRIRATDFGQGIEGALGTEAQAVRQAFKNAIPVYINDMRQATEMSAKGMDSEKELEFYLRSAGDEKSDVVTSMAALYTAGERFGTGGLEVLQGLNPELRRAVLIRAGQLLEEADSEQYRGNLSGSKSGKTPATPSGGIRKWNPQTGRLE